MKYAIFADIHANLEALNAVLDCCRQMDVDRYICLGDIVGYNSNPSECLEIIRGLDCEVVVKGNHDEQASTEMDLSGFNPQAAFAIAWTRQHLNSEQKEWLRALPMRANISNKAIVVHATLDNPNTWGYIFDRFTAGVSINYQFTPLCFYGHTHIPIVFEKFGDIKEGKQFDLVELKPGHKYLFNVGSVGQPRDGDPRASFAIYSPDEKTVEHFRVPYDIETCQKKIINAGLPERLAQRLAFGR